MVTAQGADHTVGNLPVYECADKDTEHLTGVSMDMQTNSAAADSLGAGLQGLQGPDHGGFGEPAAGLQPLAQATDPRIGLDHTEALGRWLGDQQAAVVGPEVDRGIGAVWPLGRCGLGRSCRLLRLGFCDWRQDPPPRAPG